MTITEFLLARIAEDEERAWFVARQIGGQSSPFEPWRLSWHDEYDLLCVEPSRAIAECAAKRQIVGLTDDITQMDVMVEGEFRTEGRRDLSAYPYLGDVVLRALAAVYADHPDYDPAWRA